MAEKRAYEAPQEPVDLFREVIRLMTESAVAAQERNLKFVQSTLTNTVEVFKSHIEATAALMRDMEQLTRNQQEAFQKQAPGWMGGQWMETYMGMLGAPFTAYQQALAVAEKASQ